MSAEGFPSILGLGDLATADFYLTQMGLLTGTGLLFLCAFAACLMAFRAAGSARRSRLEAEAHFKTAQSLASEIRQLTAQIELAANRPASVRDHEMGAGYAQTPAEAALIREDHAALDGGDAALEAAKKAAIEPSALLRGRLRRR